MSYLNFVLSTILLINVVVASLCNLFYRYKYKLVVIVSAINILLASLIFSFELNREHLSFYNNYLLQDLLLLLVSGIFISSLLSKSYQEIYFKYNNNSLLIVFSTLSIIFGYIMQIYRKVGSYKVEPFIIITFLSLLYLLAMLSNISFTLQVGEIIEADMGSSRQKSNSIIVVREIKLGKRSLKARYVKNKDYSFIFKCNLLHILYVLVALFFVLVI